MLGIDAGGTYVKLGEPRENTMEMHPLPYSAEWLSERLTGTTPPYLITGAGSSTIAEALPDYSFTMVPEINAIGLGGAYLAGEENCIVINIGSGTPILHVNTGQKKVTHISGTGIGSASLAGLSYYMTGIMDLDRIDEKAFEGNPDLVNLLISDIYSNPDLVKIPGDITASNFGKYQDWRHIDTGRMPDVKDLLAGLYRMVGEVLGVMANLACRTVSDEKIPVVVTGGGTLNRALVKYLRVTFEYLDQPFVVPQKAVFGTLYGLFVYKGLI
jgi:hypothetical protein